MIACNTLGEGLSGTGPKAGGPHYLPRFYQPKSSCINAQLKDNTAIPAIGITDIQTQLDALEVPNEEPDHRRTWLLPGPTGESNQLTQHACGRVLVVANNAIDCKALCESALSAGCAVLAVCAEKIQQLSFVDAYSETSFTLIYASFDPQLLASLNRLDAIAFAAYYRLSRTVMIFCASV